MSAVCNKCEADLLYDGTCAPCRMEKLEALIQDIITVCKGEPALALLAAMIERRLNETLS